MAELRTRIKLKYASYTDWQNSTLPLLPGEVAVCEIPGTTTVNEQGIQKVTDPTILFKVGGEVYPADHEKAGQQKVFKDLQWASAKAADVYGWAKASDVDLVESTVEGKKVRKLTFIGTGKDVTLDYITPAEVATITGDLDERIAALEGKFKGDSSVDKQFEALDARLDVIESTDNTKAGSIAKALKDAKDYADGAAGDAQTNATNAAKEYTDDEIERVSGTINGVSQDLAGHIDDKNNPHEVTKDQVGLDQVDNMSVADIKSEFTGSVAENSTGFATGGAVHTAIAGANGYTDRKVKEVSDKADGIAEDLAEHAGKTDNPHKVTKAQVGLDQVDNVSVATIKSNFTGSVAANDDGFVTGGAVYTAVEAAKSYADGKVEELTKGQVKTNTEAIAKVADDLAKETKAREDADKALSDRVDSIQAFFDEAAKDSEGLNNALDTLKDIQDYLNGEGSITNGLLSRLSDAEEDIDDLEKVVGTNGSLTQAFAQAQQDITNLKAATTGYSGDKTIASDIQVAKDNAAAAQADADRANTAVFGTADGTVTANGLTSKVAALENTINGTSATDKGLAGDIAQNAADIAEVKGHYVYANTDNYLYYGNGEAGYIIFDCGGATE